VVTYWPGELNSKEACTLAARALPVVEKAGARVPAYVGEGRDAREASYSWEGGAAHELANGGAAHELANGGVARGLDRGGSYRAGNRTTNWSSSNQQGSVAQAVDAGSGRARVAGVGSTR
jgi:hypothetical protein